MNTYQTTIKAQRWITIISIILLGIKFWAYYITNSVAILTDALESIVNVVAGIITLLSLIVAARPRDLSHPYGHGKAEFISAGIEGTLIALAGIFILVESIKKLILPEAVSQLGTGIIIMTVSGFINLAAGLYGIYIGKKTKSMGITATGKHLLSDAISTAGLLIGLLLLLATGWQWLDSVVALIFGCVIIVTGYKIVRSSIAGIMDEADDNLLASLATALNKARKQPWIDLHNLRLIKYGNRLHFDCHLTLPWYYHLNEAHIEVDALKEVIKNELGDSIEFFIHTDGCKHFSCKICTMDNCKVRKETFLESIEWTTERLFENEMHALNQKKQNLNRSIK